MATLDDLFTYLNDKFAAIDDKFAAIDDKFAAVHDQFAAVHDQFADLRSYIDLSVESIRSDNRAFGEGLKGERERIDGHDRDIAVLQGSHRDLNGRVTRLEERAK